jgi:Flp pilus assembly protein TadD
VHGALGNRTTSGDAYRRALKLNPAHVGALEGLGLLLLDQGKQDGALELLHRAAAKDPRRWATFNGLGVLADLAGKHALARAYFGHALTVQPNNPLLLNNLGYSHYLVGEYDAATGYFDRTLALEPGNRNAWSNLALVHTRRGQYDRAVQAMEKIMDAPSARYSVGYVCMLDGKLADAETLFLAAIKTSNSYNPVAQAALKRVREEQARANGGADKF